MCRCSADRIMRCMRNSENAEEAVAADALPTDIFTMPRSAFFRSMTFLYGRRWIAGGGIASAAGIGIWILTSDLRWLIVSLMILFIIFPMLAAFLYLSHGLRPESFVNVVPHRFILRPQGIEAVVYRKVEPGEKEEAEELEELEELEENGHFQFSFREMRRYSAGMESVTIPCGGGLLWIPLLAFGNQQEMTTFIENIAVGIRDSRDAHKEDKKNTLPTDENT